MNKDNMNKDNYTNIRLKKETVKILQDIGKKSETYDDVVVRLVKENKESKEKGGEWK